MAKLKSDPIAAADLAAFVANDSDFDLEMRVLAQLRANGFNCTHSGTYRDPVTDKIRQYDIRAQMSNAEATVALAVECKNLRANNPLLISSVPRTLDEAFHSVLFRKTGSVAYTTAELVSRSKAYKVGEHVGKKTDQVGRDVNGELLSNDEATFEKLNQAINSCDRLVKELAAKPEPPLRRVILPVLVLPNGRLWQVDYDSDGKIMAQPRQVSEATLFIDHSWSTTGAYNDLITYRISHIEIITFDALASVPTRFFREPGTFL